METTRRYYRIDRRQIAYLKFILEGYDGMATLSTLNAEQGNVVVRISPGCEDDVENLIRDIGRQVMIRPAPGPA